MPAAIAALIKRQREMCLTRVSPMKSFTEKIHEALRASEKYFKTDMVYVPGGSISPRW